MRPEKENIWNCSKRNTMAATNCIQTFDSPLWSFNECQSSTWCFPFNRWTKWKQQKKHTEVFMFAALAHLKIGSAAAETLSAIFGYFSFVAKNRSAEDQQWGCLKVCTTNQHIYWFYWLFVLSLKAYYKPLRISNNKYRAPQASRAPQY